VLHLGHAARYFATAFQNRRLLVAMTFLRTSDEEHRDAAAQQAPEPRKARPAEIVRREAVRVLGEVVELRTDEAADPAGKRERIGQAGIELATAQLPRQQEAGRKRRQELADP